MSPSPSHIEVKASNQSINEALQYCSVDFEIDIIFEVKSSLPRKLKLCDGFNLHWGDQGFPNNLNLVLTQ